MRVELSGDAIRLANGRATFDGRARVAPIRPGNLQVHWPEGNVLLPTGPDHREPGSQVPDYNVLASIEPDPDLAAPLGRGAVGSPPP